MVNDGLGGFRPATSTKEVLDYGDARIGTGPEHGQDGVDRVGNTGRKWDPRSYETTLMVAALPKSLCREIPNVYPVLDEDGNEVIGPDGTPPRRSRWVARDRDEALAYFTQTAGFIGDEVLGGGQAAIHGYDVNLDEAYPHMQLMGDTLAADPNHPDRLRVAAQSMWGIDKSVTDDRGKVEQPEAKMRRYQAAYREHMIGLGYEVERDASARSTESEDRPGWGRLRDQERITEVKAAGAALLFADAAQTRDQTKADAYLAADARKDATLYLSAAKRDAAAERADWAEPDEHGEGEGPKRRSARETARQQGFDAGKALGQAEAAADREEARQELQRAIQARAALVRAQADWKAEAPTRAALLDEWLDRQLKNGGTRRDILDAYTAHVAEQWMQAHTDDVSSLDDDDLALLVQGGTDALDDALAEAQRDKGLR